MLYTMALIYQVVYHSTAGVNSLITCIILYIALLFCAIGAPVTAAADGHKQRQLSGLAKRKDELNVKVADVRQTLAKHEQELQALTSK